MTRRPASVRTASGLSPSEKSAQPATMQRRSSFISQLGVVLLEGAEGRGGDQAGALEALVDGAAQQVGGGLQAELAVDAGDRAEGLADDEADGLGFWPVPRAMSWHTSQRPQPPRVSPSSPK
jgi:hypothetical protein